MTGEDLTSLLVELLIGVAPFSLLATAVGAPVMKLAAPAIPFWRHVLICSRDFAGVLLLTTALNAAAGHVVTRAFPSPYILTALIAGGLALQLVSWFAAGALITWELGRLGVRPAFPGFGIGARVVVALISLTVVLAAGLLMMLGRDF